MAERTFPPHAVAIVGMAGRFPGANDLDGFWRNIREGVESLVDFSDSDLDAAGVDTELRSNPRYVRRGTVLDQSRHWDAAFFGYSPREAQVIDPQQRIFLECAWEAMEHAGYGDRSGHQVVGVYAGASMNTWLIAQLMRDPALLAAAGGYQLMLGNDKDFLCTRVSYKLDLHGPSMTIQTACSTSLVAVETACRALAAGECDMALAGGVSLSFPERAGYMHQEGMILSPDGHCRPFDVNAAGTRAGAGAGIVALKRLVDAQRDRDTIHAVIRGIAINNDGAGKAGYTAPSLEGQVEVIAAAQALAEVEPRSIGYVEAHGTATPLGDPIEVAALTAAFRAGTADVGFCRLGSLKANLGHLDAAAGVAGLIKTVLMLENGELPPLVNFTAPNPSLMLDESPFSARNGAEPWLGDGPRRAAISSFGIGGTNAHAVLEEAPPVARQPTHDADRLLVLSARTEAALVRATNRLADHIEAEDQPLADVSWTLQTGRTTFACRRTVVAADNADAVRQLRAAAGSSSPRHEGGARPVAFLFPGQGSQHPGMGLTLYRNDRTYRDVIDHCAARLKPVLDLDIRDAMHGADADILRSTRIAQPTLFACSYALARVWDARGVKPTAMLGHSIGEYAAATLAGVFTLDDALAVVAARGQLMQSMQPGAMASVPLGPERLGELLGPGVEIAAVNAPDLCTISGASQDLSRTIARLAAKGIEARLLQTSHAFHSAMMAPILREFTDVVARVPRAAPTIPYVSNLTGNWITPEEAVDPHYYARQLRGTVRFADGVRRLAHDASLFILECGPGQTLSQLVRANPEAPAGNLIASSLPHPQSGASAHRAMLTATGRLWQAGVPICFEAMHEGEAPVRVPLPTYPFERQLFDVQPATRAPAAAPSALDGPLQFNAPTWTRDPSTPRPGSLNGDWLVVGGDHCLGNAVVSALADAGATPSRVVAFDDLRSRLAASASDESLSGVIMIAGLASRDGERFFKQLMGLAPVLELAKRATPLRVIVATTDAAGILNERQRDPDAALALGPVLVLPTELPQLKMRLVDLGINDDRVGETAVEAILAEACSADEEAFTAWRAGLRWLRRFEKLALPVHAAPMRPKGIYLITGGTGGIGLALAQSLAETTGARLLLTSRTAPERTVLETSHDPRHRALVQAIARIESSGGEVMLAAADVADERAMATAIAAGEARWGPINGVIHAAGVPGSGKLALRLTTDEIDATLAAKRDGLAVLRRLLTGAELDFVALMGSINGVLGAPGASDYAAANAVLDAFAEFGERPSGWRRIVAIDWGPWRDVGMAHDRLQARHPGSVATSAAPQGIIPNEGVEAFHRILSGPNDRVIVTAFDLNAAIEAGRHSLDAASAEDISGPAAAGSAGGHRPDLSAAFAPVSDGPEQQLAAIWSELVGIAGLGADDDFFELGGHSLMATRMLARIEANMGAKLKLRDVFEAPTIRLLAARIAMPVEGEGGSDDVREEIFL